MNKILILGGYGNFGRRIAIALVKAGLPIIAAGRSSDFVKTTRGGAESAGQGAGCGRADRASHLGAGTLPA